MRVFVLSCAIALILSVSSAVATLTNAQRLVRGLPVLPPKFGRALPGYVRTPTAAGISKPISQVFARANISPQERTHPRRPFRPRRESVDNHIPSLFQPL
jgi:hypothetical protein